MPITLVRIDDRIIHGQIVTKWTKAVPCHGIIIVGDDIVADEFRCKVLKAAAPSNLKVGIYGLEEGKEKIAKAKDANNNYFVISNSPLTFQKLLEMGADFGGELNVGPMHHKEGGKTVGMNLSLNEDEKNAFQYINDKEVNISFKILPDTPNVTWTTIKEKYESQ